MKLARSLLLSAAAVTMSTALASAEDFLVVDPLIDYATPTIFEGFYLGVFGGGVLNPANNYHYNYGNGWHDNRFTLGALAGYNFLYSEDVIVGAELQAGSSFNSSNDDTLYAFGLGRAGLLASESLLVYGAAGLGSYEGTFSFAVGGGVEYSDFGNFAIRGEILGIGELGGNSNPVSVGGVSAAKLTFGIIWHVD